MAPEVMQKYNEEGTAVKLDGSKTDVFSFAVLALYVVTGVMPHEGLSNKDIFIKARVDMFGVGELRDGIILQCIYLSTGG